MAVDGKYGQITLEKGSVPLSEPVVVFRAQDSTLIPLLRIYRSICMRDGSPVSHLERINDTIDRVHQWQAVNKTKVPD